MYCQGCGAEIQPGLNYCNRCGAQVSLAPEMEEHGALAPVGGADPVRWLAATICLTMLLGFAILFTAISGLAGRGVPTDPLVIISALGLCGIFATEFMLIRMMSRLLFASKGRNRLPAARGQGAKELRPATAQHYFQASTTANPLPSVTEHTTRTLEQSYRESRP